MASPKEPQLGPPPEGTVENSTTTGEDSSDIATTKDDTQAEKQHETNYPTGITLFLICVGLFLAAFCLGLDRTIITTAVPKITSEFDSLAHIGWYHSAYMLTSCCFQLVFGKLYAELDIKWLFIAALAIFEVGSVVCAAAPSSVALIIGRAVAGLGASGLMSGMLVILAHSLPLENRPRVTGAVGGAVGIAQIVAPTLGGAFTDFVSWRWCFWINLPLGAVTFVMVVFLVHLPSSALTRQKKTGSGVLDIVRRFDLLGNVFLLPAVVCLLLALQWGGTEYDWGSWRIVTTLTLFGVATVIWGGIQYAAGDNATVPLRIVQQRSMASALWFTFCNMGAFFVIIQYVPVWFQTAKGVSAYQSGIDLLAATVPFSVMVVASGFLTSKIGYYVPGMITDAVLTSVASGLILRYDLGTSTAYWAVSLVLFGFGIGIGGQQPIMIPQTTLTGSDIALGTSTVIFSQALSGTIWVSVANNIFHDKLVQELMRRAPDVDPQVVVSAGASQIQELLGTVYPDSIDEILAAYSSSLQRVWLIPLVLSCLTTIGAVFVEWKSVKGPGKKVEGDKEKAASTEAEK